MRIPRFCVTLGDPDGLGPELACRALPGRSTQAVLVLIGPESALLQACESQKIDTFWTRLEQPEDAREPGIYLLEPEDLDGFSPAPGRPRVAGGQAAGRALGLAVSLVLSKKIDGIVTLPLNKAMLQAAGFDFPGHTEMLAERAGLDRRDVCMCLAGETLRVSLVTTHPPLKDVPAMITREKVLRCLTLTAGFLADLGDARPIAVCGLNPHAGEDGAIGTEELEIIAPAVQDGLNAGIAVTGPYPADSLFHHAKAGAFGAVLAMYHDQGLGPYKLMHFGEGVNVTLGLPFVRTSVDHGTGYDLVGTGRASCTSFLAAIDLAERLTAARAARKGER